MAKLSYAVSLAFLAAVPVAHANSIPAPYTFVHASGQDGQTLNFYLIKNATTSLTVDQNFTVSNGTVLSVDVSGADSPGIMRAFASISSSNLNGPFFTAGMQSQYLDNVTISFAPDQGRVGYLVPIFALTGTTSVSNSTVASAFAEGISVFWQDSVNDPTIHTQNTGQYTGNATIIFSPIPFYFGATFALGANLGVATALTGNGTATADFGHTDTLVGLEVFDQNMNPISSPIFTSALGAKYSTSGVVPEPSSFGFFGLGTLAILLRYRCISRKRPR